MRFLRKNKKGYIGPEVIIVAALVMTFGSLATYKLVFKGSETTAHSETAFTRVTETVSSTNPGYERPSDPGPEGGPGNGSGGATVYSITYELNGGTQGPEAVVSFTENDEFNLPIPSKSGNEFGSWYESESLSGSAVVKIEKGTTGDKVFYAKWTKVYAGEAYAIYIEEDHSLRFVRSNKELVAGDKWDNMKIVSVTKNIETLDWGWGAAYSPWGTYKDNILKVVVEDEIAPIDMTNWFNNFRICEEWIGLNKIDTTNVKSFSGTFRWAGYNASSFEIDLSDWDTSNAENMWGMFEFAGQYATGNFTVDISTWDVSNVTDISYMFMDAGRDSASTIIKIPSNIPSSATSTIILGYHTWYDVETGEAYTSTTFPVGNAKSITLTRTKPN